MFSDDKTSNKVPKRTTFSNVVQCEKIIMTAMDCSDEKISTRFPAIVWKSDLNPNAKIFIHKCRRGPNNVYGSYNFHVFVLSLFCFTLTTLIVLPFLDSTYDNPIDLDSEVDDNPFDILTKLKEKHSDRPVIAHLNINFLSPNFQ